MKRILINATHNEEIRVALCRGNHLYDFDLENRTREQKKANIYKGHITRIEPSLEAVFVEYGSARQGFLSLREIAPEYLSGNPQEDNIKKLIKEGDELIIQIEKEERGNKGAAVSTYISLAGRYLVLMPNNAKGGGISRQISGKVREEMRSILANLTVPKGMSIIVRTAGIGKTFEDLQNDLSHLLGIWDTIQQRAQNNPSPKLLYQEAGVVTRAVRDYLRDDINEVWIDSEHAYNEAAAFIESVMPSQLAKLRKYTDYEPLFVRFGVERQIESAYQREVRLPSGGSIVIDQTEALVSIDINSAKSTKGSDVSETAYHTNLEAAEEIARQLRLRDIGGLIVIDFIDMNDAAHQKEVEKRLIDSTRHDRARVQFAEISKFGLMEMSRQRLRPSLEESTGYLCPRCHGNGMIRDLRSLALSIMRQIEQLALKQRTGEIQAEVPTEIAAFLLNEKRESLVYLEQDSGTRITILPHAHLESPNFELHFNVDGFAPASYSRIVDAEELQTVGRGYEVNWHTNPIKTANPKSGTNHWQDTDSTQHAQPTSQNSKAKQVVQTEPPKADKADEPKTVAWLSNLFAPKPESHLAGSISSQEVALAIEAIVNTGATSLGASGTISDAIIKPAKQPTKHSAHKERTDGRTQTAKTDKSTDKPHADKTDKQPPKAQDKRQDRTQNQDAHQKRDTGSRREPREPMERGTPLTATSPAKHIKADVQSNQKTAENKTKTASNLDVSDVSKQPESKPDDIISVRVEKMDTAVAKSAVIHISLDGKQSIVSPKPVADESHLQTTPVKLTKSVENEVIENDQTEGIAQVILTENNKTKDNKQCKQMGTPSIHLEQKQKAIDDKIATLVAARGLAKNDPRIVIEALSSGSQALDKQELTGTAGDFIRKTLPNAEACLVQDGFVACFIKATALTQGDNNTVSMANYGYAPLSDAYLADFEQSICASATFSIAQGKTAVTPILAMPRAKNDPRGNVATDTTKNIPSEQSDVLNTVHVSKSPISTADKAAPVSETAVQEKTDTAFLMEDAKAALSYFSEQLSHILDDGQKQSIQSQSSALENTSTSDSEPTKTTPAKYKNMIENIAEQLLPQTGILKLATPKKPTKKAAAKPKKTTKVAIKIPKADTKPKTEVRKRPKKEQIDTPAVDNSDTSE